MLAVLGSSVTSRISQKISHSKIVFIVSQPIITLTIHFVSMYAPSAISHSLKTISPDLNFSFFDSEITFCKKSSSNHSNIHRSFKFVIFVKLRIIFVIIIIFKN
jgi:hypothetical protein